MQYIHWGNGNSGGEGPKYSEFCLFIAAFGAQHYSWDHFPGIEMLISRGAAGSQGAPSENGTGPSRAVACSCGKSAAGEKHAEGPSGTD